MNKDNFIQLLQEQHTWPGPYTFKFILKASYLEELLPILVGLEIEQKNSKTGNFLSITGRGKFSSPEEVFLIYQKASKIEGIIQL